MPTLHDPLLSDVPAIVLHGVNGRLIASAPYDHQSLREIHFRLAHPEDPGDWRAKLIEYRSPRRSVFVRTQPLTFQALDGRMISCRRSGLRGTDVQWTDFYVLDPEQIHGLGDQDIYDALGVCEYDSGPAGDPIDGRRYAYAPAIRRSASRVVVYQQCGRDL